MNLPVIKIENIKKSFAGNDILSGISLEIYSGEILGIVGASGSGKTTFLNTIIGFLKPDTGTIYFKNKNIFEMSESSQFRPVTEDIDEVKRTFGFAAQHPSVYLNLTVFENLDYFGALYNLTKEARLTNINTLLDLVELDAARDVLAKNLSGGMLRRLDIACSLIHDPEVLILDEPTSDLDPILAKHIWGLLQKINKRGTTVIVASHHFTEIEEICSRIGILSQGKIEYVGTLNELTSMLTKGLQIRIETYPGNYEKILKALKDPLIIEKENRGSEFVIHTSKPEKVLPKILKVITEMDENLMDVSISKLNLKDVFSKLNKKKK
ncbi:ABC transporter ATP-binding protein [Candidatus Woesearchaeota archaeon]|nr:ABC transporter ATP-binding protein [Candidatus Woesearchaeota archaeon]